MTKFALFAALAAAIVFPVSAQELSLQIAPAVAGQGYNLKSASFVFRSSGCADLSKLEVVAKAEGKVDGQRRTLPLKTSAAPAPGVFAVFRSWPAEGVWIVSLAAKCGPTQQAGALVVTGGTGGGPNREASRMLNHAPTEADIDAILKTLPTTKQ